MKINIGMVAWSGLYNGWRNEWCLNGLKDLWWKNMAFKGDDWLVDGKNKITIKFKMLWFFKKRFFWIMCEKRVIVGSGASEWSLKRIKLESWMGEWNELNNGWRNGWCRGGGLWGSLVELMVEDINISSRGIGWLVKTVVLFSEVSESGCMESEVVGGIWNSVEYVIFTIQFVIHM